MKHYIYRITCLITYKFYYGMHSTLNLDDCYFSGGKILKNSVNKHGKQNHVKEILEFLPDRDALKKREREIVNESLLKNPLCMNLKIGGEGGGQKGIKRSPETIAKMIGKKRTPEQCQNIANSLKGKKRGPQSPEILLKRSIGMTGVKLPPFTEEHLEKMRIARRKRIIPKETGVKISNSLKKTFEIRRKNGPIMCPHCGKWGGFCGMKTWHFNNCKFKNEKI